MSGRYGGSSFQKRKRGSKPRPFLFKLEQQRQDKPAPRRPAGSWLYGEGLPDA